MMMLSCKNLKECGAPAFTLVELIVSMTIFTIFVGVVTSTFLLTSRTLREANEVRKVYTEARFLMDRLTQDIRLNKIDYDCLNSGLLYQTVLYAECQGGVILPLISADGMHRTVYRFEGGVFSVVALNLVPDVAGGHWTLATGYTGFERFDPQSVTLERVAFNIFPGKSPYDNFEDVTLQYQPSVHVEIDAMPRSTRLENPESVQLRTTVTSRIYQ